MGEFEDDVVAQLAALSMAVMQLLKVLAVSVSDPETLKLVVLESGLRDMSAADDWGVSEAVLESAKARYTALIMGAPPPEGT